MTHQNNSNNNKQHNRPNKDHKQQPRKFDYKKVTRSKTFATALALALGAAGISSTDFIQDTFKPKQEQRQSNNSSHKQSYRKNDNYKKNNSSQQKSNNKNNDWVRHDYNKEQPPFDHSNDGTVMGDNPGIIELGKATFTKDELNFVKKGWVNYEPLDKQGRATKAEAVINKEMINTGTKANPKVRPPGFKSGLEPYGHSRGHLIGRQFGGSGDDMKNLVTMYQEPVNSPLMTDYENMIRWAVGKGDTVRYRVIPVYDKQEPIPTEILMEAQSIGNGKLINFNIKILNTK